MSQRHEWQHMEMLRQEGMERYSAFNLLLGFMVAGIAWYRDSAPPLMVLLIGLATGLAPFYLARRGRHDQTARIVVGLTAPVAPALLVWVFEGSPWQMDMHMSFFAMLIGVSLFCDGKALLVAAGVSILHHLIFGLLVPAAVFDDGEGGVGRVLVHGILMAAAVVLLARVIRVLGDMLLEQTEARIASERVAEAAVEGKRQVEAALVTAREAEARAAIERKRREDAERESAAARQASVRNFAAAFQASVADVVNSVAAASTDLEGSARSLNDVVRQAHNDASDTAVVAAQSSRAASTLAERMHDLSTTISDIAASVDRQASLAYDARTLSASGHRAVHELTERTQSITGFAESIDHIASRTNLLALNATIEAARAGDVGRGFAVVAGEVKQLAGQASSATGEIRHLAGSVEQGADVANGSLKEINKMVDHLAEAAQAIRTSVDGQRETANLIGHTAHETAQGAALIADQIGRLANAVSNTEALSSRVSTSASSLSGAAQSLQRATERFVQQISAA